MPVRTARLAAATSVNDSIVTVYTCPAGKTAIIKDVRLALTLSSNTRSVVRVLSGPVPTSLLDQAQSGPLAIAGAFVVLEPGDQLQVLSTGGTFHLWASGAELEGVAP